jgi:hypothetical protein
MDFGGKMSGSFLAALRNSLSGSRRKSAEAAENAKARLFAERLGDVLGQLGERERKLLRSSAQPAAGK